MLDEHLGYVSDSIRLNQYDAALRALIRPGDRCVDLGCGTGVLGLLALKAGASHVHCIETTSLIDIARETFERAGYANQATFYQAPSQRTSLPERVDVLLCDHVGYFGFDYGIVPVLNDARARFLRDGGIVLPQALHLQIAAVGSERCLQRGRGWLGATVPSEFRWLAEYSLNSKHAIELKADEMLGPAVVLGEIDLRTHCPNFQSWNASLRMERDGVAAGLCGWFDCDLAPGVGMTNSPRSDARINRPQAFLPFRSPVSVSAGEVLQVTVSARMDSEIIAWSVATQTSLPQSLSTWNGKVLPLADLARAAPDYVPQPRREALARASILGYCDGTRTASEIEGTILRECPDLFPTAAEISKFVAWVLGRDTR
jgi:SAM-dependent methyltransferase